MLLTPHNICLQMLKVFNEHDLSKSSRPFKWSIIRLMTIINGGAHVAWNCFHNILWTIIISQSASAGRGLNMQMNSLLLQVRFRHGWRHRTTSQPRSIMHLNYSLPPLPPNHSSYACFELIIEKKTRCTYGAFEQETIDRIHLLFSDLISLEMFSMNYATMRNI